ncbi:6-phosphofructokinase [Acetobacter sp. CAG:977]|nr:6-phosphofructokinase [Acetobacter sp. CAG:977]
MGRDAGHIALHSAIAGGADVCLIPEVPYTLEGVVRKLHLVREQGRDHALVVVAEGVKTPDGNNITVDQVDGTRYGGIGHYLSVKLNEVDPHFSTRVTVLGHVQRGGVPAAHDRLAASAFGVHAVDVLAQGKTDRMVAWKDGTITDVGLDEVVAVGSAPVDPNGMLVKTARGLGMYIGE